MHIIIICNAFLPFGNARGWGDSSEDKPVSKSFAARAATVCTDSKQGQRTVSISL